MARAHRAPGSEVRYWETETLQEHVALIKRQVDRSLDDPETHILCEKIIQHEPGKGGIVRAWGQQLILPEVSRDPGDYSLDELHSRRIWNFVVTNWSYIEDPPGFDLFATLRYNLCARQHADKLERLTVDAPTREMLDAHIRRLRSVRTAGAGDCDDASVVIASLHRAAGFQTVRARVVSIDGVSFGHVYPVVAWPRTRPTKSVPMDPTVKGAVPGWEYEASKVVEDLEL